MSAIVASHFTGEWVEESETYQLHSAAAHGDGRGNSRRKSSVKRISAIRQGFAKRQDQIRHSQHRRSLLVSMDAKEAIPPEVGTGSRIEVAVQEILNAKAA